MTAQSIHVVAAVLYNRRGEVLLAQRPPGKHLSGLWEFPGGKVEPGESAEAALRRELREELAVQVSAARPLIALRHRYPEKTVWLDVWRVESFRGEPHGHEGQALAWVSVAALKDYPMPAADAPVVTALRLPDTYVITPEPGADRAAFERRLRAVLAGGARLVQLRAKHLIEPQWWPCARAAVTICREFGAQVLINARVEAVAALDADGVHLTSTQLRTLHARPLPPDKWVAASCHSAADLGYAAAIGVDFVVLGPVCPTATHPEAQPLGWERFAALVMEAPFPVFALGGLSADQLGEAQAHGAQGIAGIRSFWLAESAEN